MITAYSYYLGRFWGGEKFNALRKDAKPFDGILPRNCCYWKTKD